MSFYGYSLNESYEKYNLKKKFFENKLEIYDSRYLTSTNFFVTENVAPDKR